MTETEEQNNIKKTPLLFNTQEECADYYGYNTEEQIRNKDVFIYRFKEKMKEKDDEEKHAKKVVASSVVSGYGGVFLAIEYIGKMNILETIGLEVAFGTLMSMIAMGALSMIKDMKQTTRMSSEYKKLAWQIVMQENNKFGNAMATPEDMVVMKSKGFKKTLTKYREYATQVAKEAHQSIEEELCSIDERTGIFEKV